MLYPLSRPGWTLVLFALVGCQAKVEGELFQALDDAFVEVDIQSKSFRGIPLAVGDLVGDNLLDVVIGDRNGGLWLYENRGGLQFADVTEAVSLGGLGPVQAIAIADLEGDGANELLVAGRASLIRYRFVADQAVPSEAVYIAGVEHLLPFDVDGDGLLEVHAATYVADQASANHLFFLRNDVLVSDAEFSLASAGRSWSATIWDADGDGLFDLYVANDTLAVDFGDGPQQAIDDPPDLFYLGQTSPTGPRLVQQEDAAGLGEARSSMGGRLLDLEGRTVLFVPDFGRNKAFEWTGQGFESVGDQLGLGRATFVTPDCTNDGSLYCLLLSWGTAAADFDLDGRLELIVVNAATGGTQPPVLWYEWNGERFNEVSTPLPDQEGLALVAADFDRDGDDDLLLAGRFGRPTLLENRSTREKCPRQIYLRGARSNREGRGAVVTTYYASGGPLRHWVGAGGNVYSSASVELSDGRCDLESIEVLWPSGVRSSLSEPPIGPILLEEP